MKTNVGSADRIIRLLLAAGIGGAGIYFQNWLGLVALVPLLTAVVGFCPLYSILGISTCPVRKNA